MKIFKKLIDKYKKYVYYNITNITLVASITLLLAGAVLSIKNFNREDEESVKAPVKWSFYKNQKEAIVEKFTHGQERKFELPRLKSNLEKREESQKKFIYEKIEYPKVQKSKKPQRLIYSNTKNKHYKKGRRSTVQKEKAQGYSKSLNVVATAYTAFCSTGCIGKTKTGYDVTSTSSYRGKRIIAVDPNIIPLYSLVEVRYKGGSFQAYAIDTGGDIKSNRIDILMNTKSEAKLFGRQQVNIRILENN
ncbi:3D domain-containing protein [Bacillus nakamurai]|uniref:3D domain-containing protein n=1 Tax=Bacillus nakamurai TaxID=1793963 RepID=A0A150FB14_9BACI|nr:3D domain-containing protein [Bacillus nakamurai]KXZ22406.1 hypothetical protein AXI58_10475 [Bacillus nakamurai]MED1228369.1 3D domain-containing protein [Bacillus nakamurai]